MRVTTLYILIVLLFISCKEPGKQIIDEGPPFSPTPYQIEYPLHFYSLLPIPVAPDYNPTTEEGVALGRKLYYEKRLSEGGPFAGKACASCHHQSESFTSVNTRGNSIIPHFNLDWSNRYLWNGQYKGDMENVTLFEVDGFFQTDLSGIKNDQVYQRDFKKAFADGKINSTNTAYALAQFMRTMISGNSRFDNYTLAQRGLPTNGASTLSASELRGLDLFMSEGKGDCFHCHGSPTNPLWTDNKMRNIGLDVSPDSGLAAVSNNPKDLGKFKTSSLRNLVFTAPYMHDGRFSTLGEVIDFYTAQVEFSSPNLDPVMRKERNLNSSEKSDLIAFLKALTDSSYTKNPALSNPHQ